MIVTRFTFTQQGDTLSQGVAGVFLVWQVVRSAALVARVYGRAVLSVDDGRRRGNLIECPRPGCPTLSGVVAATWGRGRPDMSYGSVVLHGRDYGAATVVLPVPRLRTIYTRAGQRERGSIPATVSLTLYTSDRRIIGIPGATMDTKLNDIVSYCDRVPRTSLRRDSHSRLIAEMGNGISLIAMCRGGETDKVTCNIRC